MSHLQTLQDVGAVRPSAGASAADQGILVSPGEIRWTRLDWAQPVGAFVNCTTTPRTSRVLDSVLEWNAVCIDELWLSHKAALLLLQGAKLSDVLVPNHRIVHPMLGASLQIAHVVLRVDPWQYWLPRPVLRNLMVATLGPIPLGLSSSEVLAALAFDSASAESFAA